MSDDTVAPGFTPADHARRILIAEAIEAWGAQMAARAREDAAPAMAKAREEDGQPGVHAIFGDLDLGYMSIPQDGGAVTEHSGVIYDLAVAADQAGEAALEQCLEPHVAQDPRVIALVAACLPELVSERVDPAWKRGLIARVIREGDRAGQYISPDGTAHQVLTYRKRTASGRVTVRPAACAVDAILGLLRSGQIPARLLDGLLTEEQAAMLAPAAPPALAAVPAPGGEDAGGVAA
jgi:hypothetical protein